MFLRTIDFLGQCLVGIGLILLQAVIVQYGWNNFVVHLPVDNIPQLKSVYIIAGALLVIAAIKGPNISQKELQEHESGLEWLMLSFRLICLLVLWAMMYVVIQLGGQYVTG